MLATIFGTVLAFMGPFMPAIGAVAAGITGIYLLLVCLRHMRKIVVGPDVKVPSRT